MTTRFDCLPDFDAHTHRLRRDAVVCIDPLDLRGDGMPAFRRGYVYSVGIHPWNVGRVTDRSLRLLASLAAEPQVVAIGECGLDGVAEAVCRGSAAEGCDRDEIVAAQTELLRVHFALSERLGKPMILHVVKAYAEILRLKKLWQPSQPWVIHGFRGKPQLARQLLDHGFYLSFGRRYNAASLALTPPSRLLRESDDEA